MFVLSLQFRSTEAQKHRTPRAQEPPSRSEWYLVYLDHWSLAHPIPPLGRFQATALLWRGQRLGLKDPMHRKLLRPYLPKGARLAPGATGATETYAASSVGCARAEKGCGVLLSVLVKVRRLGASS